ncbi:hypothetical protein HNP84_000748 [Thermocatellispora tengchongensis]|uniref:Uncharacterized protein n=1 Tax=Thermocatellispora tengchongensis TaxID=1073253 RepID=A0A840NUY1_9ACTN|nr:hypothetical protein [Thermocatellispora tengchongensis]MBB5131042.1 hypothetical protein [Thermocatellispora tengchongensis]
MRLAVIVMWLVTAVAGAHLLCLWLPGAARRRQAAKVTRFPVTLTLSHPLLASGALGSWVGHLLTGHRALAWAAFGLVALAALLGFAMFTRWLGAGRHARGAERGFPKAAVVLHGAGGVATFVLILLATVMLDC